MSKSTITINGRLYDAITGMPITHSSEPAAQPQHKPVNTHAQTVKQSRQVSDIAVNVHKPAQPHQHRAHSEKTEKPATAVHQQPHKSQTLNRHAIKKPTTVQSQPTSHHIPSRSPSISHFSAAKIEPSHQVEQPHAPVPTPKPDHLIPPHTSPLHVALARSASSHTEQHHGFQTSKQLKEHLIREKLAEVSVEKPRKQSIFKRRPRLASVLASTLSLLILGGYFTYINLSNISMQVASTKAGITAEFPRYQPSGFSLSGPITYSPGEVSINYKSNTGDNGFTITQKAANWDSQAVLDNYVRKQSNTYLTFQDRGITVYTFNNKAAWSNGGMLYTIDGDANLSSEQVLRLATSM